MIVKIKLLRHRANEKVIEHSNVLKVSTSEQFYIVKCKKSVFKYPIVNIWSIEEQTAKPKSDINIQRIRIDDDRTMEQDIKGS